MPTAAPQKTGSSTVKKSEELFFQPRLIITILQPMMFMNRKQKQLLIK